MMFRLLLHTTTYPSPYTVDLGECCSVCSSTIGQQGSCSVCRGGQAFKPALTFTQQGK